MKTTTHFPRPATCFIVAFLTLSWTACAQSPEAHYVSAIGVSAQGAALLRLAGPPPAPLQSFYDLFPILTSADLVDWRPLATVLRTNVTNEVVFTEPAPAGTSPAVRFYRTPTNHFSTPFLTPSGPYAVGTLARLLTDPSRSSNRFGLRTNSSFMLTLWYPAERSGKAAFAPYSDRVLAQRKAFWGTLTNRVPLLVSQALDDASLAAGSNLFPVIIYSHGLGDAQGRGVRTENTAIVEELASHGYVVASVDHTDTYGTVFPPDQFVLGARAWSFDYLADRLKDVGFLLDYIAGLNAEDPLFRGRLDLDRLGIMGWSFGGGTAAEACRAQDRLKAAVLLDAYLGSAPTLLKNGLGKPFISMNSGALIADNNSLFGKAASNAYILSIKGAAHEAFTDNSWMISPSPVSRRQAVAMGACMLSFFDKHLKGLDDQLLDNPAAIYPEVVSFRKK